MWLMWAVLGLIGANIAFFGILLIAIVVGKNDE